MAHIKASETKLTGTTPLKMPPGFVSMKLYGWMNVPGLKRSDLWLVMYVHSFTENGQDCFASNRELMSYFGYSEREFYKAKGRLEDVGMLATTRKYMGKSMMCLPPAVSDSDGKRPLELLPDDFRYMSFDVWMTGFVGLRRDDLWLLAYASMWERSGRVTEGTDATIMQCLGYRREQYYETLRRLKLAGLLRVKREGRKTVLTVNLGAISTENDGITVNTEIDSMPISAESDGISTDNSAISAESDGITNAESDGTITKVYNQKYISGQSNILDIDIHSNIYNIDRDSVVKYSDIENAVTFAVDEFERSGIFSVDRAAIRQAMLSGYTINRVLMAGRDCRFISDSTLGRAKFFRALERWACCG